MLDPILDICMEWLAAAANFRAGTFVLTEKAFAMKLNESKKNIDRSFIVVVRCS